jgi:hypothetical protein
MHKPLPPIYISGRERGCLRIIPIASQKLFLIRSKSISESLQKYFYLLYVFLSYSPSPILFLFKYLGEGVRAFAPNANFRLTIIPIAVIIMKIRLDTAD